MADVNGAQSATITVHRTSSQDMEERELYVSLDGGPKTILRFGHSVTVPISPGHHTLRVHNTISRRMPSSTRPQVSIFASGTANVRGKGFEILAMFFGIAPMHTVLERE
jgi:hypothetical protein